MKHSVLIVDDEKVICDGVARLLSANYIVYKATNAMDAIEIVRNNQEIDVVLCDLVMPGMDGNEMIEAIRSENKDISMIVLTAIADPRRVCDAMRKGANSFLLKPLDITLIESSVHNAVINKRVLSKSMACH